MPASGGKAPWKTGKKALQAKGADFKRVKSKVGRKLPPPTNATKTDFKSKAIVIPGQSVAADKEGVAVNQRKQTLKELLTQTMHYSEKVRKEALMGLKDLFARFPTELPMHAMPIVERLSPRITDYDKAVRQTLLLLLRTTIFPGLPQGMMTPLVPGLMAHVSSAMTHLVVDVRASACSFLDLLVQHYPDLVVPSFSGQIVQHFVDLLGRGGVSSQAVSRVGDVLNSLVNFLTTLKSSLSTQSVSAATNGAQTHCWGQKYSTTKQERTTELLALHGHNSRRPEGYFGFQGRRVEHGFESSQVTDGQAMGAGQQTGVASKRIQNTGVQGKVIVMAAPLVPVLIDCWADCAPTVCAGPMPDAVNLSCMVSITQALSLLFQCFSLEGSKCGSHKSSLSSYFVIGEEDWEMRIWMRQQFLSGLQKHILAAFPVAAPSIRLPAKVEENLVALNVGICEVMLHVIVPPHKETENRIEHYATVATLQYYESALCGMMLPSSELAAAVVDSKLAEPHLKLLISHLPVLLSCIAQDWTIRLLQAFTKVFESSKAHSAIKLSCLSAMAEILLSQGDGGKVDVPLQFQKQWMQALPRLLWEVKHTHVSVTEAVLQMLLHIGRSAPEGSILSEEYTALQPHMIPFFCTFLASSKSGGQWKCLFGPFVKLPKEYQELAVDTMCYWKNFSSSFLKAVAHCCVSEEVSLEVATRSVEVLQNVFMRGSSGLAEHLSFLVTLLAGHTTAQAGKETLAGALSSKARIKFISTRENPGEALIRRKTALAGVVCSSLTQLGDCNLVLDLLGPSIQQELVKFPSLGSMHSFLCAVAVLSTDKRSDSSDLPKALQNIIPQCVAEFLIALFKCESSAEGNDYSMNLHRPCFVLLSRSQDFIDAVLNTVQSFLHEASQVSTGDLLEDVCATTQMLLLICKQEKLSRMLSSSKDSLEATLLTLQAYAMEDQSEKLRSLYSQLDIIVAAL